MTAITDTKTKLRRRLRAERRAHAEALPQQVRALVFHRPPGPVLDLVPDGATVALYAEVDGEAPTGGYLRFFHDRGHPVALPWFAGRNSAMTFRKVDNPYAADLVDGPFGLQPSASAVEVEPDLLFVPLLGFTADGTRLGQGGGHYDRWLADHPSSVPIGLAWDIQEQPELPTEPHDARLRAVVTPTRFLGPFE